MAQVQRYQLDRWHQAVAADAAGGTIVLDGDPFKLHYPWPQLKVGDIPTAKLGPSVSDRCFAFRDQRNSRWVI